MTALMVEGVTLQDLDAHPEATCDIPECDAPAVTAATHPPACSVEILCHTHTDKVKRFLAEIIRRGLTLHCTLCHTDVAPQSITLRPI